MKAIFFACSIFFSLVISLNVLNLLIQIHYLNLYFPSQFSASQLSFRGFCYKFSISPLTETNKFKHLLQRWIIIVKSIRNKFTYPSICIFLFHHQVPSVCRRMRRITRAVYHCCIIYHRTYPCLKSTYFYYFVERIIELKDSTDVFKFVRRFFTWLIIGCAYFGD